MVSPCLGGVGKSLSLRYLIPLEPCDLEKVHRKLHMKTAQEINLQDTAPGRKAWYQFWDSHFTFERSYLARLNYVHYNPAKHGVTRFFFISI